MEWRAHVLLACFAAFAVFLGHGSVSGPVTVGDFGEAGVFRVSSESQDKARGPMEKLWS